MGVILACRIMCVGAVCADRVFVGTGSTMSELFRPRRRPALRLALALGTCIVLGVATGMVIWLRLHVVPPDCTDPSTLQLVHQSLTGRFRLPASVSIENIETLAGGYLAFRFVCEGDLRSIDPRELPPDTPVPGTVLYTSRLTANGLRHEVTVSIQPLLKLERVQ
jgi:hypothetical protein